MIYPMLQSEEISIHAPIVGCDTIQERKIKNPTTFQSTHPSWGATPISVPIICINTISIHAPIVGCDSDIRSNHLHKYNFNPRTHRGVRRMAILKSSIIWKFQSTHPSWGATKASLAFLVSSLISIHAPIVGCDTVKEKK